MDLKHACDIDDTQCVVIYYQEIVKVRERILGLGLIPTVIPLSYFLDMVPSSSENATPAMRGQPTRLSRN